MPVFRSAHRAALRPGARARLTPIPAPCGTGHEVSGSSIKRAPRDWLAPTCWKRVTDILNRPGVVGHLGMADGSAATGAVTVARYGMNPLVPVACWWGVIGGRAVIHQSPWPTGSFASDRLHPGCARFLVGHGNPAIHQERDADTGR